MADTATAGPAHLPLISFCKVEYQTAGGKPVLSNFDLTIHQGETFALLGRSGSGKTTVLRLINRLLTENAGEIRVEGQLTRELDPISLRRRMGYVLQEGGLFPHYTVAKNVELILKLQGKQDSEISERVDEMLRLVDLDPAEFRARYPHQLSGGQRQRVGVARALAGDPPILLMDEPFGALDPVVRAELQRQFKSLQEKLRKTVVLVTHDLREALLLGTRIGIMDSGRLTACYSPAEFLRSRDPRVSEYLRASGEIAIRMEGTPDADIHGGTSC